MCFFNGSCVLLQLVKDVDIAVVVAQLIFLICLSPGIIENHSTKAGNMVPEHVTVGMGLETSFAYKTCSLSFGLCTHGLWTFVPCCEEKKQFETSCQLQLKQDTRARA